MLLLLTLCLALGGGTTVQIKEPHSTCEPPFTALDDHCVYSENLGVSDWVTMQAVCDAFGGHLVKLDDANFHYAIVHWLNDTFGDDSSYWIGASEVAGYFRWHDSTPVKLGTPFWGDGGDQVQRPVGDGRCIKLDHNDHLYFSNADCYEMNRPVCQLY